MADWQQTYDPRDLNYLSRNAKQIRDTASLLGVPALGLVGGVAREMAYARNVHPLWAPFSEAIKDFQTSYEPDSREPDFPTPGAMAWKDLFRTGSTGSPDVPSPDAATGDQVRGWVRALRSAELMPQAGGAVSPAPGAPVGGNAPIGGTSQGSDSFLP